MAERKVTTTVEADSITFAFSTGEKDTVKPSDFKPSIQKHLMLHGLRQKLGDSYSGEDADKCHKIFSGVLKALQEERWTVRVAGGGPRISQLADALARVMKKPVDLCIEKIAGMSDEEKLATKKHPDIIVALAAIKLEKAQAEVVASTKAAKDSGKEVAPLSM